MNANPENVTGGCGKSEWSSPRFWLRQFLAGNPFYIVSAGFLLYGIYCVSMDPRFAEREMQQLLFNFGSLQFYGLLLTFTALFLARRRIWYDSTLLVVIESALVFVPFLLVSQAISLSKGVAYLMCGLATLLAGIKFSLLKRFYPKLNLPPALLFAGAAILIINCELPLLFKTAAEASYAAMALDVQEAGVRLALTGILPALIALALFLPRSSGDDGLAPRKHWLPLLIYFLWVTATGIHMYSIRYVYKTPFQLDFFAPAAWVAAWVLASRLGDAQAQLGQRVRRALLLIATVAALPIMWPGVGELSGFLLLCNVVLFAATLQRERSQFALHLMLLALAACVAELSRDFWLLLWPRFNAAMWVQLCGTVYVVLAAATSRNPKLGLVGAVCAGWLTALLLHRSDAALHIALQAGLAFGLLHSMVWRDEENVGSKAARINLAVCWASHSVVWAQSDARFSFQVPATVAGAVVVAYFAIGLLANIWASRTILIAAAVVLLSTPGTHSVEKTRTTSPGVLVVIGSFILFGVGTWFALAKTRWLAEKPQQCRIENSPENRE